MSTFENPDISVTSVDVNQWVTSREDEGDILGIGFELPAIKLD